MIVTVDTGKLPIFFPQRGEFGIRTRALNTAFFDNPQCGFYFVGSILKRSWVPNCHLKLRGKAIDILPLGARLKKYGHLNHPHISTTNHLGHDNKVAPNFCSVDSGFYDWFFFSDSGCRRSSWVKPYSVAMQLNKLNPT